MTEEFAARRRVLQDSAIEALLPYVTKWLNNRTSRYARQQLVEQVTKLYVDTYLADGGKRLGRTRAHHHSLRTMMQKADVDSDPRRIATWLAVATLNAAGLQAASEDPVPTVLKWTTMHDSKVREEHAAAEGQRRSPGSKFHVGGEWLRYPGDPAGRLDNTINCRCVLQPVPHYPDAAALTASTKETTMPLDTPLAWHGVLAPEGVWSGDGRRFAEGSLRNRDLPLPLTWQKATNDGHDTSTTVARIDSIERVGNMLRGEGVFVDTPETDEVVGLIAEFGRFGVSVDADDSEFEFDEASNKVTFTSARIASASIVSIPAFAEAFIALGTWAEADEAALSPEDIANAPVVDLTDPEECDPDSPDYEDCLAKKAQDTGDSPIPGEPDGYSLVSGENESFISEGSWDGSAGRFTPEQWKRSTILHVCDGMEKSCHKLPIREPGGALSRAGVHAAAARFNQVDAPPEAKASAARQLRGAYKQLGEEVPDAIKAAAETEAFGRGPGWVTNPEDTRRIWAYWTQPGHEGYAKVNWGVPGDFNRCRAMVGEEIGENSPDALRFLNQICAQWHHDATGAWPGHAPGEQVGSIPSDSKMVGVSLVASAEPTRPSAAWFADPKLTGPTHLQVTEDGRVFGHLAEWKTCHIGYDGVCVAPPASASGYAYFATGTVLLDNGDQIRTGVISLGGGHAGPRMGARAAAAHYDSTSTAVADVIVGEDEFGIWVAGAVRPGVQPETIYALRASDISGDWREIGGSLELVAALACNVAGFPVAAVQDKVQVTLVAAGVVQTQEDDIAVLVEAGIAAAFERRARMARLRARAVDWTAEAAADRQRRMAELRDRVGAN